MKTDLIRAESAHSINGVPGRLFALHRPPAPWKAGTFANQSWVSEPRKISGYGTGAVMTVDIRFDDRCKNGHNDFAITADVVTPASRRRNDIEAGGCLHDEIAQVFPELAHLIRWHLSSTEGPMHYIGNVTYHASDRDYNGRAKGEPCAWAYGYTFDRVPLIVKVKPELFKWIEARRVEFNGATLAQNPHAGQFHVTAIAHVNRPGDNYQFAPKWTFVGFGEKWHDCPFDDEATAQSFAESLNNCSVHPVKIATDFSKGKERDLRAARACAAGLELTDEQLCLPKEQLSELLKSHLPGLLAAMRADIEGAGFMWQCPVEGE